MTDPGSRQRTRSAVMLAAISAGLMLGQTVFAKATRDALFLTSFPVTVLPRLLMAAAVLSLGAMLISSRALAIWSPARVVPAALLASGALYLVEWWLAVRTPEIAAVAVYLHVAVLSAIVSSGFWSLVNERFDPHTARRVFGRIAAGGTAGAVVGGLAAWQLASVLPVAAMLAVLSIANLGCALAIARLARLGPVGPVVGDETPAPAGLRILREVPYLQQLGLLVGLMALVQSQLDYVLKDAAAGLSGQASLVTFFALFHAGAGVLSFGLQSFVSRPALDKLGLAGTIALLPLGVVLAGFVRLLAPALWASVLLAGVEAVLSTSLYRAGYELLYTPLAPEKKRPTKGLIDVGLDRLGMTLGGGATMIAVAFAGDGAARVVVAVAIAAALLALVVAIRLHEGYVAALAESLRSGAVRLDPGDVLDAASRRTLAETHVALDRAQLLEEIGRLRSSMAGVPVAAIAAPAAVDALLDDVAALRSGDPVRVQRLLSRTEPIAPELVGFVVPWLGRTETARAAGAVLRTLAPRVTGQLVDALLDRDSPVALRRRLPRILAAAPSERAVAGLLGALDDAAFEVRFRAALALLAITEREGGLAPARDAVLAAARREIASALQRRSAPPTAGEDELAGDERRTGVPARSFIGDVAAGRIDQQLECIFAILSLTFDREPMRIALRALATEDQGLRGTALEYLDNVLPDPLFSAMRPLLHDRRPGPPSRPRPPQLIASELLQSSDAISLKLREKG